MGDEAVTQVSRALSPSSTKVSPRTRGRCGRTATQQKKNQVTLTILSKPYTNLINLFEQKTPTTVYNYTSLCYIYIYIYIKYIYEYILQDSKMIFFLTRIPESNDTNSPTTVFVSAVIYAIKVIQGTPVKAYSRMSRSLFPRFCNDHSNNNNEYSINASSQNQP